MPTQALLPILLLCVLLLQAQGGLFNRNKKPSFTACDKQPSINICINHCSYFQKCPKSDTVCCSTFCGNVCMSLL
ncbi:protein WFDC10B [Molossus molossus]|uniref:WAP four-disulfide core domain 10B n=1 Tax=Molossus molossus TaxID=27622 RepID=A0A7J8HLX8_MOLMO|nr:protein WFDC10B [Molossus molossus]KAF6472889.1 WAP four-disulfide core domain 10B [Molossus molossus]